MRADAHQILISQPDSKAQQLDAGRLTLLAVHESLILAEDRAELKRLCNLAHRFARNRLATSRSRPDDIAQAAHDVVQDFCVRVKDAEARASAVMPLGGMLLPNLLDHLVALNDRYGDVATRHPTRESAGPESPGRFMLSALKQISDRALHSNPMAFSEQAKPWTPGEVDAVIAQGLHRMSGYGITVLLHCVGTAVRLAEKHAVDTYDEVDHHDQTHVLRQRATSVVMSPHMRAVVVAACAEGHKEVMAEWAAEGKQVRNLPFLDALIGVLPLLLEAPDEKPVSLAKQVLQGQKRYSSQEIHRGLTAAERHPIYQRVCRRIWRGDQWDH